MINCTSTDKKEEQEESIQKIVKEDFGVTPNETAVEKFTLTNANGLEMCVITYGGIITSLKVPDREGNLEDIVLGYDNLQSYIDANPYFGAIVGRYGNRIADGKFSIDEIPYELAGNNNGNHLHGGLKGFDKVVWKATEVNNEVGVGLVLTYLSVDGEEGYPGNLNVTVTYMLSNDNMLEFDYQAETDKATIVNLTQHTYFNLTSMKEDILGHQLKLNAPGYLPVDSTLIPTGEIASVEGTPFDFTTMKVIGADIQSDHQQMIYGGGYDHCWVLKEDEELLSQAAILYEENSGRLIEIYTTEPGIQFYTGNFLDGSYKGKNGVNYTFRSGLCLETQHFPNSPNQDTFPTTLLKPGEKYHSTTRVSFSIK